MVEFCSLRDVLRMEKSPDSIFYLRAGRYKRREMEIMLEVEDGTGQFKRIGFWRFRESDKVNGKKRPVED